MNTWTSQPTRGSPTCFRHPHVRKAGSRSPLCQFLHQPQILTWDPTSALTWWGQRFNPSSAHHLLTLLRPISAPVFGHRGKTASSLTLADAHPQTQRIHCGRWRSPRRKDRKAGRF
jgi:hypothetical protein